MKDANDLLVAQGPEGFVKTWGRLVSEATARAARGKSAAATPRVAPAPEAAAKRENGQDAGRVERGDPREQGREAPELVLDAEGTYLLKLGSRTWRVKGLSAFGVDRLRVNVRVDEGARFHVDTFDLYSARSRQSFIEGAMRALRLAEGDEAAIGDEITLAIEALERERLSLRHQGTTEAKEPAMSAADREGAMAFLKGDIVAALGRDFLALGCVGEETALLIGYLALISRKLENPLSVLFCARSGAGKSMLQDTLADLCPPEDVEKYTRISSQVLFFKGENALRHKLIVVEEEDGAASAAYALRSLISTGVLRASITRTDPKTGRQVAEDYLVKGPVVIFITSAHPEVFDYETRNRYLLLTVDESREQTRRILERQQWEETAEGLLARHEAEAVKKKHHNAQRLLEPLHVVIPVRLTFPDGHLILRRELKKKQRLAKAIALLHQHQRPRKRMKSATGETIEYIEVTTEDVALCEKLAPLILKRNLDELAPPARSLYVAMRDMARAKKAAIEKAETADTNPDAAPTAAQRRGAVRRYALRPRESELDERLALERREIQRGTGLSLWHIKTYMPQLLEYEYVTQLSGSKGKRCLYLILEDSEEADL